VWEEQGSYIAAEKTGIITTEEHRGLLLLQGEHVMGCYYGRSWATRGMLQGYGRSVVTG